jgi:hypothetical protein
MHIYNTEAVYVLGRYRQMDDRLARINGWEWLQPARALVLMCHCHFSPSACLICGGYVAVVVPTFLTRN